ncbi:MAG: PD-(D/E)XK nuclease family protein [Absicoccus sp.]|uniref:PD-(D/E)XK nuclease family protein n=1 Tax=Absicoccus sp. TaxID=2718527 RepID=UPI002A759538|nr:PD-(D/E)XK nuclease family protein [Absicoccus sp.]MDY3034600.1 PD-(D/E)XK nuclease family protein [Absicoccus sp.]
MHFPEKGTIIAPASMHLALYAQIGNHIGLQVLSLQTFVRSFLREPQPTDIEYIYQIKEHLQELDSSNPFYASRKDPEFLKQVFQFLQQAHWYGVDTFPCETSKEKALFEIIQRCQDIHFPTIEIPQLHNVYILRREYPDFYWIDVLLDHGAQWIESQDQPETHYVTMATSRKQAQWICEEIIHQKYDANDVYIAVNDAKDQAVLIQMLETYQLPYTLSKVSNPSLIPAQWLACLDHAKHQDRNTLCHLIQVCFPKEKDVLDWYALGYQGEDLYEANEFVDPYTYAHYQHVKAKAQQFEQDHDLHFSIHDFEKMATLIQSLHAPTQENINIFNAIQELILTSYDKIHTIDDLDILYHAIQNVGNDQKSTSLEGVWIGPRQDISPLRKITFFLNVHSKTFPALRQESGIFNEDYVSKTNWPSLAYRLDTQKERIRKGLDQPDILYISYPQTDYQSKAYEPSVEINDWLGTATFIDVLEPSHFERPVHTLSKTMAETLFVKNGKVRGSVSSFETFVNCPFRYFLQYGLYVKEAKDWTDIRVRGSLLHKILEEAIRTYGKDYIHQDLDALVDDQFEWITKHFPAKQHWIQNQKNEVKWQLHNLLQRLRPFEEQWHMEPQEIEHEFYLDTDTYAIHGFIDRVDGTKGAFVIFDYKTTQKEITMKNFTKGLSLQLPTYAIEREAETHQVPIGIFYVSLTSPMETQVGVKLNYQRKKDNYDLSSLSSAQEEYFKKGRIQGWVFDQQDLTLYDDSHWFQCKTKIPSFVDIKTMWEEIITSIVQDIRSGTIAPEASKEACTYCPYRSICRTSSQIVEKPDRIKEE